MEATTELVRDIVLVEFIGLAVITLGLLARRRTSASAWAAATFSILGIIALAGRYLPQLARTVPPYWLLRGLLALLLVVPYAIFRFAAVFDRPRRSISHAAWVATATVVGLTFVLPRIPSQGQPVDGWFLIFRTLVGIQWIFLFSVAARRLWHGGQGQAGVVAHRTRLLAAGAAGMNVPIVISVLGLQPHAGITLTSQIVSAIAAASFALGLAPPISLKNRWRRAEVTAARDAVGKLLEARNAQDVVAGILPHVAGIVGGVGAELHDSTDGIRIAYGIDPDQPPRGTQRVDFEFASGTLSVWTSRYTPFFGTQELAELRTLTDFVELALVRCRLVAREQDFIANAAHELRTPLTVLAGLATTLAQRGSGLSEPQVRDCINAMERHGTRATRLVHDLLDLADLERAPAPLKGHAHEVGGLIDSALSAAPTPTRLVLAVHGPPGLTVNVHAGRFEQVLVNLLTNAYRYARSRIDIGVMSQNGSVLVWIADDGPGVPAEFVPRMFEPFQRGRPDEASGSGLGLAIARRVVAGFDGQIRYVPSEDGGARFEILLPVAATSWSVDRETSLRHLVAEPVDA